jgi:hypothetical protein
MLAVPLLAIKFFCASGIPYLASTFSAHFVPLFLLLLLLLFLLLVLVLVVISPTNALAPPRLLLNNPFRWRFSQRASQELASPLSEAAHGDAPEFLNDQSFTAGPGPLGCQSSAQS